MWRSSKATLFGALLAMMATMHQFSARAFFVNPVSADPLMILFFRPLVACQWSCFYFVVCLRFCFLLRVLPRRCRRSQRHFFRQQVAEHNGRRARSGERDWPVCEDHCFQRILLDNAVGAKWTEHIAAPAYKKAPDRVLKDATRALQGSETPLYVVQFSDAQHVRVFGHGNMVGTLFSRTDLTNAWTGPTNAWGYASIPIDRLAERPDARIIVIEPYPRGVGEALKDNRIWQHLPAVREGRVSFIEPIWPYGGLRSA